MPTALVTQGTLSHSSVPVEKLTPHPAVKTRAVVNSFAVFFIRFLQIFPHWEYFYKYSLIFALKQCKKNPTTQNIWASAWLLSKITALFQIIFCNCSGLNPAARGSYGHTISRESQQRLCSLYTVLWMYFCGFYSRFWTWRSLKQWTVLLECLAYADT